MGVIMEMHPHLMKALQTVVSMSKDSQLRYFRLGVARLLENRIKHGFNWLENNKRILSKLGVVADAHEDDMALCQFAIDEWIDDDRAVGMRYIALCKRFNQLMPAERKRILKEEIEKQKDKIEDLAKQANALAKEWLAKLSNHTYNLHISTALQWLSQITAQELMDNYNRWEKEKL